MQKKVVITAVILGGITALIGKILGGDTGNVVSVSAFLINGGILYIGNKVKK